MQVGLQPPVAVVIPLQIPLCLNGHLKILEGKSSRANSLNIEGASTELPPSGIPPKTGSQRASAVHRHTVIKCKMCYSKGGGVGKGFLDEIVSFHHKNDT